MPRYFISALLLHRNRKAIENTFIQPEPHPGNVIALYNKNENSYSYWKIIKQPIDRYGYIVERESCPEYWKSVIKEEGAL